MCGAGRVDRCRVPLSGLSLNNLRPDSTPYLEKSSDFGMKQTTSLPIPASSLLQVGFRSCFAESTKGGTCTSPPLRCSLTVP